MNSRRHKERLAGKPVKAKFTPYNKLQPSAVLAVRISLSHRHIQTHTHICPLLFLSKSQMAIQDHLQHKQNILKLVRCKLSAVSCTCQHFLQQCWHVHLTLSITVCKYSFTDACSGWTLFLVFDFRLNWPYRSSYPRPCHRASWPAPLIQLPCAPWRLDRWHYGCHRALQP